MIDQHRSTDERVRGVDFRANIKQAITQFTQLTPFVDVNSILYPSGFQLDVNAPAIRVRTQEEFTQVMGKKPDTFYQLLLSTGGCSVEPQLGLLNIVPQSDKSTTEIEYKSRSGGKDWKILAGVNELRIEGTATDEELNQALDTIFPDGKPNTDSRTIHISKATVDFPKSLKEYDRDGNLIQS
ncbi:hypothetical protein HZB96_02705 [Candidatus Gottesmanbacteria bacterium]|nr:hypothetical protein [Candidatus Gottesmanbacteria bacterium]